MNLVVKEVWRYDFTKMFIVFLIKITSHNIEKVWLQQILYNFNYGWSLIKWLACEVAMIKIDMKRNLKNYNLINQN